MTQAILNFKTDPSTKVPIQAFTAENCESVSAVIEDVIKEQVLEDLDDVQTAIERENESAIDLQNFC